MTEFRPKGGVTPYLNVDGARKALDFYKAAFGGVEREAIKAANGDKLDGYFHYHGVRGGLLLQLGDCAGAREAFNRAIALAGSPAEAAHIRLHLDRLSTLPALPPASAIK